jgi:hypothetical protein
MERLARQVLDGLGEAVMDALVQQTEDGTTDVAAALLAQARDGGDAQARVRRNSVSLEARI